MINNKTSFTGMYGTTINELNKLKALVDESQCLDLHKKNEIKKALDLFTIKITDNSKSDYLDTAYNAVLDLNNKIRILTGNKHYIAKRRGVIALGTVGLIGLGGGGAAGGVALSIVAPGAVTLGAAMFAVGGGGAVATFFDKYLPEPEPDSNRALYLSMKPILKSLYNLIKNDYENQNKDSDAIELNTSLSCIAKVLL